MTLSSYYTNIMKVVNALFGGHRPAFKLPDVARPMRGPSYIVDNLIYDAANLRADIGELEPALTLQTPDSLERLNLLIEEAEKLDLAFEGFDYWKDGPDEKWHIKDIDNSFRNFSGRNESIINGPGAPDRIHVYTSIIQALHWNLIYGSRLMLNQTIITCLRHFLHSDPDCSQEPAVFIDIPSDVDIVYYMTLYNRAEAVIDEMIEDICASVAFHISSAAQDPSNASSDADVPAINGFFLVWPLAMMMISTRMGRVGHFHDGRWEWIKSVLEFINRGMGISQAGAFINNFY